MLVAEGVFSKFIRAFFMKKIVYLCFLGGRRIIYFSYFIYFPPGEI